MMRMPHAVAWPVDFNLFHEQCWKGGVFRFRKMTIFSVFSRKRFFILFYERGLQTEMFKIMKAEQFSVFLAL